jgi:hypothetical protein
MFSLIGNVIVLNTFERNLKIETDMPKWVNFFRYFFVYFIILTNILLKDRKNYLFLFGQIIRNEKT